MKALAAGKHVLLEKPSANTAEETHKMFAFAEEKRLVLLEAFHYRYALPHMSGRCVPRYGGQVPSCNTPLEGDC
jgi:predicted dehydrogenase